MRVLVIILILCCSSSLFAQGDTTSGWRIVFSNPGYGNNVRAISQMQFPSKDTGYAFAYNGLTTVTLRSTDAGLTWDSLKTSPPIGNITFTSALVGYDVDYQAQLVWKTIDGGQTWQSYPRNSVAFGPIVFANADTGIVVGPAVVARTIDGGQNWTEYNAAIGNANHGVSFGSSSIAYGVGVMTKYGGNLSLPPAGGCQKTTDAGISWTQVYTGISADISCCQAITDRLLYVACNAQYVARTDDGGATWQVESIVPHPWGFYGMSFADGGHGLIVGNDDYTGINAHGIVYATVDSGKSWQKEYLASAPELSSVAMLNDSVALICGGGNIYRTTTGGAFSSVTQPVSENFQVQVFPNPTAGVTTIQYQLPTRTTVSFRFYDVLGNTIRTIPPQLEPQGLNQITFDGSMLAAGVYYFTLTTGQGSYTGQTTVQK